jgi:hypothetical protein
VKIGLVVIMIALLGLSLINFISFEMGASPPVTGTLRNVNGHDICDGTPTNCNSFTTAEIN